MAVVKGTRILTDDGYKTVETLDERTDRVLTSDGRALPFKMYATVIEQATASTAPYRIMPHAFGRNVPVGQLCLSPTHKVCIRKGLWLPPDLASTTNPLVQQYGVGSRVEYIHIACNNFLRDNLVAEGAVIESFGTVETIFGPGNASEVAAFDTFDTFDTFEFDIEDLANIYTWNDHLGGYTRSLVVRPRMLSLSMSLGTTGERREFI